MQVKRYLVLAAILTVAVPVWAEESGQTSSGPHIGYQSWGLRAGVANDPDQAVGGVQFNFGEFTHNLRFQPDIELGFGDHAKTLYATVPVYYRFGAKEGFTPYVGGGVAFGFIKVDLPPGSNADDTSFEVGGRLTGGVEWGLSGGGEFAIELSLGTGDIHDAQVVAVWNF